MTACNPITADTRRGFWTTQPNAGTTPDSCRNPCGVAGLLLTEACTPPPLGCGHVATPATCRSSTACERPRTIVTDDWVRSLALNILLTDGRAEDSLCGRRPGTMGGHWSESLMTGGKPVGNRLRFIGSAARVSDLVLLIRAEARRALGKLIDYKVAVSVDVVVTYAGNNAFAIDATILTWSGSPIAVAIGASRVGQTLNYG